MCPTQSLKMGLKMKLSCKSLVYRTLLNCVVIFSVFVIKCQSTSLTDYPDTTTVSENGTFYNFMCPDSEANFCINGTIPHQETLKIHSEKFVNFSINAIDFVEHRICVKSVEAEQITITRCLNVDTKNEQEEMGNLQHNNNNLTTSNFVNNVLMLRKCCPTYHRLIKMNFTKHVGMSAYECIKTDVDWNPALFPHVDSDFSKHIDLDNMQRQIVYSTGFPACKNYITKMMDNNEDIGFKILKTGQVYIGLKFWFKPVWLPVHDEHNSQSYCLDELYGIPLDSVVDEEDSDKSHKTYHKNQVLAYCEIERFDDYLFHRKLFGILCVSASCTILLLLIIYLSIWDRQNLAGWTQFNIFVAVFFVFGMEGVRTLVNFNGLDVKATVSCTIVAAIAQYFFFALNTTWFVMNFDLSWTFWKLESSTKGLKGKGRIVTAYLVVSWILPLILILFLFGLLHFQANESKENMNGIYSEAHRRCSSPVRTIGFGTLGVMFLINSCFFALTASLIWRHRRGITTNRRNSRNERHTWRSNAVFGRVILFSKLFMVMALASLSIPLDFFFGSDDPLNPFEVLFRMVHFIPVLAILFIFGFNEKNMHLIKQKYPNFGTVMGMQLFSLNRATTETNASPSGGQNSIEIK